MKPQEYKVTLTGSAVGIRTLDLVMLIREKGDKTIAEANKLVSDLTQRKPFTLTFDSQKNATAFLDEARRLRAIGSLG